MGYHPKICEKLFIGTALPEILYGADVWYVPNPVTNRGLSTRQRGMVKVTAKLASTQRAGAIAITEELRIFPSNTLDALANLLPFKTTIEKWCYRSALRLAVLSDKHPLCKPIKCFTSLWIIKHCSPLHHLIQTISANSSDIGTMKLAMQDLSRCGQLPLKIRIPQTKEDSAKEA